MDSFFAGKGFKASKCKTLLKLTIPRIKLLRNRRELQIKQMRRDIAKLLETGQEATARIRVEHIIREEKMAAAQEIIELFCELIVVRLPIIEAQKECPLDLKEAISSVCFAAPRCADLQELQQVQILFAGKYGKEFVSAASELMPECGVNRQLIELLSIRAPAPEVKLKLLKEIAEELEIDWDPSASETELLKPHEDLLNGPTQFVSGSKIPLPIEKLEESSHGAPASEQDLGEKSDSDSDYDIIDLPEVPKQPLRSNTGDVTAPEMLPFPASAFSDGESESVKPSGINEGEPHLKSEDVLKDNSTQEFQSPTHSSHTVEEKQFVPFILPPLQSSASISARQSNPPPAITRTKSETPVDLQDVLAAAQAAAESAERAAAAARSAASLAQMRISELAKKKSDEASDVGTENPFHVERETLDHLEKPHIGSQNSLTVSEADLRSPNFQYQSDTHAVRQVSDIPPYDDAKVDHSSQSTSHVLSPGAAQQQFQRLPSMDEEAYFSYPNLFTSQGSAPGTHANSFAENSKSTHDQ